MPDLSEAIKRLRYIFSSEGADKVVSDQNKVGAAVTASTTTQEKASLSLEKAFNNLERRYVSGVKAQQDYEKVTRQVNAAMAQNPALMERGNALLAAAAAQYGQAGVGARAFAAATSGVSGQLIALSAGAGPAGTFLAALGPWGVAAAVGIGAAEKALSLMSDAAHGLAQKSEELRKFSEVTGLSTNQIQALRSEASKFGVTGDEVQGAIQQFTARFNDLRVGQGELLTQVRRVNPALADQMAAATNAGDALTLFGQALQNVDNVFQRNALVKAATGRGGLTSGAFLTGLNVDKVTDSYVAAGKALDENLIKKLAQLEIDIAKTSSKAQQNIASIFSQDVLEAELKWAQTFLSISEGIKSFTPSSGWFSWTSSLLNLLPVLGPLALLVGKVTNSLPSASPSAPTSYGSGSGRSAVNPLTYGQAPADPKADPRYIANTLKDQISAMGDAATISQKLELAQKQLAISGKDAGLSEQQMGAAIAALNLNAAIERLNLYNAALGAGATVADQVAAKNAALLKQQQQGAGLSEQQLANSRRLNQAQADGTFALQAQIDTAKVQIQTYDMAAGASEKFRLVQTKINENLNAGRPALDGVTQEYLKLANAAGASAQALEQNRVNSTISFGGKTAFLTSEDVQIATQLKGLYGNDVPAAMASSEASALRLNNAMSNTSQQISGGLSSALSDVASGTKTAGQAFADFGNMAARAIQQMIIQLLIVGPLMRSLQSAMGGGFSLSSIFGGGTAGNTAGNPAAGAPEGYSGASAMGNVFNGPGISAYSNKIVTGPTYFASQSGPMAFARGGGLMGEAGPEAIMPLRRGADGRLGVAGAGGAAPVVNVTLIESPDGGGQVNQKQNANGGIDIEVSIAKIAAKSAVTPGSPLNRSLVDQMGAQPRRVARG
jgi:hypothetical protein